MSSENFLYFISDECTCMNLEDSSIANQEEKNNHEFDFEDIDMDIQVALGVDYNLSLYNANEAINSEVPLFEDIPDPNYNNIMLNQLESGNPKQLNYKEICKQLLLKHQEKDLKINTLTERVEELMKDVENLMQTIKIMARAAH